MARFVLSGSCYHSPDSRVFAVIGALFGRAMLRERMFGAEISVEEEALVLEWLTADNEGALWSCYLEFTGEEPDFTALVTRLTERLDEAGILFLLDSYAANADGEPAGEEVTHQNPEFETRYRALLQHQTRQPQRQLREEGDQGQHQQTDQ